MPHHNSQEIYEYQVILPKENSSFLYFILESNENICFYSTLPFEKGQGTRELIIRCTPELEKDLSNILKHCQQRFELTIQSAKKIKDL